MKRILAGISVATMLVALLPATVSADRLTKYHDHHVGIFCETAIDGGFASIDLETSSQFGDFGGVSVWLAPADRELDPPSVSGSTDGVEVTESPTEISARATLDVVDTGGSPLGSARVVAIMTRVGDPEPISQLQNGNHHSATQGTVQNIEGSATLHLPGLDVELSDCFGDVTDISVFEANPRAFVSDTQGVTVSCFWETDESAASLFAIQDQFGFSADAFLSTANRELFAAGNPSGTITRTALSATLPLEDPATGDPFSAAANAALALNGGPVTSTHTSATSRQRVTEQALTPTGALVFSSGDSFAIDEEHCDAVAFQSHSVTTAPNGPKPDGKAPANDTPEGALTLEPGDRFNVQTGGASRDAELQVSTCPEGIGDQMGRTLWYAIKGTGDPITVDSAGSNFDTLIAVYDGDVGALNEIACDDDVFSSPVGSTFQAALTFDTVAGVTYHVQVGGFMNFFGGEPQFGRLRLDVS